MGEDEDCDDDISESLLDEYKEDEEYEDCDDNMSPSLLNDSSNEPTFDHDISIGSNEISFEQNMNAESNPNSPMEEEAFETIEQDTPGTTNSSSSISLKNTTNKVAAQKKKVCGVCGPCKVKDDCGSCRFCKDKPKFGGTKKVRNTNESDPMLKRMLLLEKNYKDLQKKYEK